MILLKKGLAEKLKYQSKYKKEKCLNRKTTHFNPQRAIHKTGAFYATTCFE